MTVTFTVVDYVVYCYALSTGGIQLDDSTF